MEAFRHALAGTLRERLLHHLRVQPQMLDLGESYLASLIARGTEEARRFRLTREADLLRFLNILALFCGPAVERGLPVQALQILLSYGLESTLKLDRFSCWVAASMINLNEEYL